MRKTHFYNAVMRWQCDAKQNYNRFSCEPTQAQEKPTMRQLARKLNKETSGNAFTYFFFKEVTFHWPNYRKTKMYSICRVYSVCLAFEKLFFIACITPAARNKSRQAFYLYGNWLCVVCQLKCSKQNMVWNVPHAIPNCTFVSQPTKKILWKTVKLYQETPYLSSMSFNSLMMLGIFIVIFVALLRERSRTNTVFGPKAVQMITWEMQNQIKCNWSDAATRKCKHA